MNQAIEYASAAEMRQAYKDIKRRFYTGQGQRLPEPAKSVSVRSPCPPDMAPRSRDIMFVPRSEGAQDNIHVQRSRWRDILYEVAEDHGVTAEEIRGPCRRTVICKARHEVMYRMRAETPMSYPEIGHRLGDRDHSTVVKGIRKHIMRMQGLAV